MRSENRTVLRLLSGRKVEDPSFGSVLKEPGRAGLKRVVEEKFWLGLLLRINFEEQPRFLELTQKSFRFAIEQAAYHSRTPYFLTNSCRAARRVSTSYLPPSHFGMLGNPTG